MDYKLLRTTKGFEFLIKSYISIFDGGNKKL